MNKRKSAQDYRESELGYKEAAKDFLENEKQFQLGVIPTEQSNPVTKNLSFIIAKNTEEGVRNLLAADEQIPLVVEKAMATKEFDLLIDDLVRVMTERKKFVLSSVGASGRMALTLGSMWRKFWFELISKIPNKKELFMDMIYVSDDFMTGGDRALVQSVENYEDYMSFGREQIKDAKVGPGDVVLALAECALSASIDASALEGDDLGISTYFFYTNPKDILSKTIDRARLVFERKNIKFIDLYVGNMAVAGSTRMQSATVQLLAVGAAFEIAISKFLEKNLTDDELKVVGSRALNKNEYAKAYSNVLKEMNKPDSVAGLSKFIEKETDIYTKKGLVTYIAHDYLIDIMTDTTERQPTFTLPPFRKFADKTSGISWAYVKDPLYPNEVAWQHIFYRPIKGLDWTVEDYIRMKATHDIISNPPLVGSDQVFLYNIGNEDDQSRYSTEHSVLMAVDIDGSVNKDLMKWFESNKNKFSEGLVIRIGDIPEDKLCKNEILIPVETPKTPLNLMTHLVVKVGFNLVSTGTMAKMGRIWGNWMIQVFPTNKKLIDRSTRIIANIANIPYEVALEEFFKSYLGRAKNEQYRESFVVETLRRLGFEPKTEL
ncbi:MAG: hypothetical protein PHU02_03965 [Bacilli bacterium]|nr:hypothetical protein [Bacilli bacterium]MDD2681470.1 hypothetical protein [Bacilli bacterium]MDD3121267.1 hypothetical protein [Bacilli bacterium]MDD4062909.1 hypothetical protein [Bacilli bacterium]MDD4481960.1 hypothetical protein [Bacilli bacterium]